MGPAADLPLVQGAGGCSIQIDVHDLVLVGLPDDCRAQPCQDLQVPPASVEVSACTCAFLDGGDTRSQGDDQPELICHDQLAEVTGTRRLVHNVHIGKPGSQRLHGTCRNSSHSSLGSGRSPLGAGARTGASSSSCR